jgi:hypothetical protein
MGARAQTWDELERFLNTFTGKGARKPRRSRRGGMALPGIFLV